jgi:hypothetical protein
LEDEEKTNQNNDTIQNNERKTLKRTKNMWGNSWNGWYAIKKAGNSKIILKLKEKIVSIFETNKKFQNMIKVKRKK